MANKHSRLDSITIQGLGVIESATLDIGPGLTVLTGETGAGKTMVLTALSLLLGGKADSDFVRQGSERAAISGEFALDKASASEIEEAGYVVEDGSLLISRTLTAQGKSRILVGGVMATANQVSDLSGRLVEIHSQSGTTRLLKTSFQRTLLDQFAMNHDQRADYHTLFDRYNDLRDRIKDLRQRIKERDREVALLQAFLNDFSEVNPLPGELVDVENEISKLSSVELLNTEISHTLTLFEDEEISVFNLLQQARRSLELTRGKDAALDALIDRFLDQLFSLQDLTGDLSRYLSQLEADPQRFEHLQNRKSKIASLLKKYGKGNDRNIAYDSMLEEAALASEQLSDLIGGDDRLAQMEAEQKTLFEELRSSADRLSLSRTKAAQEFSEMVSKELTALSMPNAQVVIEVVKAAGDEFSHFSSEGLDDVKFLFNAHKNGSLLPLNKIASGGEMSRVMLAIEVVLAHRAPVGTYIFDEIDAGVGGKAALEVGKRLALLAQSAQVIVVTHLAQVAAWAENHWVVRKNESGLVTQSDIIQVSSEARASEIARMLSGQEDSALAREHAEELLKVTSKSMIS